MGVVRFLPVVPRSSSEGAEASPAEASDGELVLQARTGSREAQETLFRRHVRRIAGLSQRLLASSPHEVDDLLQDVFVTAFLKLADLKEPRAFAGWLSAIAIRTASKRLRRRRLGERLGLVRREAIDLDDFALPHHGTDTLLELKRLYSRLERFPAAERVALLLRRVEGMEIGEIAEKTGTSISTAKRRLRRAEERIARLSEEGHRP